MTLKFLPALLVAFCLSSACAGEPTKDKPISVRDGSDDATFIYLISDAQSQPVLIGDGIGYGYYNSGAPGRVWITMLDWDARKVRQVLFPVGRVIVSPFKLTSVPETDRSSEATAHKAERDSSMAPAPAHVPARPTASNREPRRE